jgi:CRISPR-associated protein Cmr4
MITDTQMLYLYVETPLHAGVGSGLSSIDLPIQRERATQYPMIQGSGIKGKLRAAAEDMAERKQEPFSDELVTIMFGPRKEASEHAGALIAGDARILLFPVRSLNGVFAYTTSYDVLNRFMRDINRGGGSLKWEMQREKPEDPKHVALVTTTSRVTANNILVLEEFSFTAEGKSMVDEIATWIAEHALPQNDEYKYWREKVKDSLVILPEDDFRDFVLNATEIITRISIDRKTKTAAGTALWTEEHLPTDTLLYVPIYATQARKSKKDGDKDVPAMLADEVLLKVTSLETSQGGYLQLGGDETVGRGMVRIHWSK